MATPAISVSRCITKFMYEQNSITLQALRAFIEQILVYIDAQIIALRLEIADIEPAKLLESFVWSRVEQVIEKQKSNLVSNLPGPAADICPEFYTYITAPAVALLEASLAAFLPYKAKYQKYAYASAALDAALAYWENTKSQLLAILDVLDDALYNVLILEAVNMET